MNLVDNTQAVNTGHINGEVLSLCVVRRMEREHNKTLCDQVLMHIQYFVRTELEKKNIVVSGFEFDFSESNVFFLPYSEKYLSTMNEISSQDHLILKQNISYTFGGDERCKYSSGENIDSYIDLYFNNSDYNKETVVSMIENIIEPFACRPPSNIMDYISQWAETNNCHV